jgi:hypothetical protein
MEHALGVSIDCLQRGNPGKLHRAITTRAAAGALGTRHSPRPLFDRAEIFLQNPRETRRGNAKLRLMSTRATLSTVIARESGDPVFQRRMMESRSRGGRSAT